MSASPASPDDGDRYIVADTAGGEWISHVDSIATWNDYSNAWSYSVPGDGWAAYNEETETIVVYNATLSMWIDIGATGVEEAPLDGYPYCRMTASWVRAASEGGDSGILPIIPTATNCLGAFTDTAGQYLKQAGEGAFVNNGLFVKTPHSVGYGKYKIKQWNINAWYWIRNMED